MSSSIITMESALTSAIASSSLSHFNYSPNTTTITTATLLNSSLSLSSSSSTLRFSNPKPLSTSLLLCNRPSSRVRVGVRVRGASSSNTHPNGSTSHNINHHPPILLHKLKTTAGAIVFAAAAASASMMIGKFFHLPARAETAPPAIATVTVIEEEKATEEGSSSSSSSSSPLLSQFLESNSEAIDSLKSMLQQKIEIGEDEEALRILKKLVSAQPEYTEWKFLMARLLNEMGKSQEAREAFEDILRLNPLSFEALFENALLMDRCGEEEAVIIVRLEEALRIAEEENKLKEARDVRLIMAQIHFLQKNVDEALNIYDELLRDDPNDFRPYFCKGMIFSLLDRNNEAKQQFYKYRQLSPKKFNVEGYLRSPLSRIKLFGTNDTQN